MGGVYRKRHLVGRTAVVRVEKEVRRRQEVKCEHGQMEGSEG